MLSPLVVLPGVSPVGGADIRLTDPNGNTRPEWLDDYKTSISGVKVWTKSNQLSSSRASYLMSIGNAGHDVSGGLGGTIDRDLSTFYNNSEYHKIKNVDLTKHASGATDSIITGISVIDRFFDYGYIANGLCNLPACPGGGWSVLPEGDYLSGTIANSCGKSFVIDSFGYLHFVYCSDDGTYDIVYHSYSVDGGKSWTSEKIYDNATSFQYHPSLVIDSSDTLHFVWAEEEIDVVLGVYGMGNEHIKYRNKSSAGVFSAVEVISRTETEGLSTTCLPVIQVKPDSVTIGIMFQSVRCIAGTPGSVICYIERSSVGVWSVIEYINDGRGVSALDYDLNSIPHTCIRVYDSVLGVSYIIYSNRIGGAWTAVTDLVASVADIDVTAMSNIVVDVYGRLHLCYRRGSVPVLGVPDDSIIYHIRRETDGSWSSPCEVENSGTTRLFVSIQVDIDGNCQVVYCRDDGSKCVGCYKTVDNAFGVSEEIIWYSVDSVDAGSFSVIWSHYPSINGQFTQLSRQSNCFIVASGVYSFPVSGDLHFVSEDSSVIGGSIYPTPTISIRHVQRGIFGVSSISKRLISCGSIR